MSTTRMFTISSTIYSVPGKDNAEDAETSASTGGRPLCDLQFTDDIEHMGCSEEELQQLSDRPAKQLMDTIWKSAAPKANSSSTALNRGHLSTCGLVERC